MLLGPFFCAKDESIHFEENKVSERFCERFLGFFLHYKDSEMLSALNVSLECHIGIK